jgi:excisionase family DNA binding protein
MNTQEAAARLGLSREYIQRLATSGRIKARKIGLVWQIAASDLAKFEKSDRKRGPKVKAKS